MHAINANIYFRTAILPNNKIPITFSWWTLTHIWTIQTHCSNWSNKTGTRIDTSKYFPHTIVIINWNWISAMSLHRSWRVTNRRGVISGALSAKWVSMLVHTITWPSLKTHNGNFQSILFFLSLVHFVRFWILRRALCATKTFLLFIKSVNVIKLIECNRKICFETSAIDRIHIVCGAFIDTSIHLCGRINFDFRFYSVVSYSPFVHLIKPMKP